MMAQAIASALGGLTGLATAVDAGAPPPAREITVAPTILGPAIATRRDPSASSPTTP